MFLVGRVVDRYGTKLVAVLGAIFLGVACMVLSYVMSPATLFVGFFLARFAGKGSLELSSGTMAPQWFISRRAFAIMLVGLGGTLGGVLFPLLNSYLITAFGWRIAYRILAGGLWLLYVPITAIFLISRPEDAGMSPHTRTRDSVHTKHETKTVEEPSFSQAQAIRTSAFWIIVFCVFQMSLVGTGVTLHFVSIFEEKGFSMAFAARIMGIRPLVGLGTTIFAGLVLDRVRRHNFVLTIACILQVVGFTMVAFFRSPGMAFFYAVISGIAGGLATISIGVLTPNLFGRKFIGGILGVSVAINVLGSAIGPVVFGAVYDAMQGYTQIILISALLPLIAGILCLTIRKPVLKADPATL